MHVVSFPATAVAIVEEEAVVSNEWRMCERVVRVRLAGSGCGTSRLELCLNGLVDGGRTGPVAHPVQMLLSNGAKEQDRSACDRATAIRAWRYL